MLTEVFVPAVDERRAALRQQLGTFDEKDVLIIDGCKAHKIELFRELLAQKNMTVVFLVPHSESVTKCRVSWNVCTFYALEKFSDVPCFEPVGPVVLICL